MKPYEIILADDHTMFREGIKRIIESKRSLRIIGEVNNGLELLDQLKRVQPDLVILDISMPYLRGLEATREINKAYPKVNVLILTMHKSRAYLHHAIEAGVNGYLLKEDADHELFSAIEAIREGKTYISPLLSPGLTDRAPKGGHEAKSLSSRESLTLRERQVLKLVAEGKTNKDIADLLFISTRTVENHRANIMRKMDFHKVVDLVKYAIREGYTEETK
jgi:DNA-binding NarL/FixJ family response regulator